MLMKKVVLATVVAMGSMSAAMAANCSAVIEANDAMQYNTKEITVSKACPAFEIELKHTGSMPKAAMGHNVVVTKTADEQGVITDGMAAGEASNYVKEGDARVIAHTKLIGGGESDKVSIDTAKLDKGGDYSFFCTFPGHASIMKGAVKVTD
ncbi:azurin [Pelistega europaea]|uniref:Azurin n=1 Tax=Pelistega europaea TaxID=106147 RepID=A0A7Y4LAA8_9BURK|nr:azurin [Pelistega europaea]NOL49865.1 azurin [Pelistega europaea]